MRIALALLLVAACHRPNRVCVLTANAQKHDKAEGSCDPISYGETTDFAIWDIDDGKLWCHDTLGTGGKEGGPLVCSIMEPTKAQIAADAKARAEADAKAKIEAEAKAKADAPKPDATPNAAQQPKK